MIVQSINSAMACTHSPLSESFRRMRLNAKTIKCLLCRGTEYLIVFRFFFAMTERRERAVNAPEESRSREQTKEKKNTFFFIMSDDQKYARVTWQQTHLVEDSRVSQFACKKGYTSRWDNWLLTIRVHHRDSSLLVPCKMWPNISHGCNYVQVVIGECWKNMSSKSLRVISHHWSIRSCSVCSSVAFFWSPFSSPIFPQVPQWTRRTTQWQSTDFSFPSLVSSLNSGRPQTYIHVVIFDIHIWIQIVSSGWMYP